MIINELNVLMSGKKVHAKPQSRQAVKLNSGRKEFGNPSLRPWRLGERKKLAQRIC